MKSKQNNPSYSFLILFGIIGLFLLGFLDSHQTKGTFWADETGVVLSSITKLRSIKQIFYDAANTSQPPLDHIFREKIYVPLGETLGLTTHYPELFHRFAALLWWLLPLCYLAFNLKHFSAKNKTIIIFALLLLVSSGFLRHYLAEARHYSAIPAVFTTMIIMLLSDRIPLSRIKYRFLIISSLFPFLHLISFPFYLIFMAYFFYQIRKELNLRLILGFLIFIGLVLLMDYEIKRFSSPWQHPSWKHLLAINVVKGNIKWTLDWIFYPGVLYPIFKLIPEIIKDNLLYVFAIAAIILIYKFTLSILDRKRDFINLPNLLLFSLIFIWPVFIFSVLGFSGMFSGERYSIVIMPIALFYISWLITTKTRIIFSAFLGMLSLVLLIIDILPLNIYALDTPDNQFVKQNIKILKDKDAYLILDNGVYSAAFFPLAAIHKIPIKVNYLQCRDGQFQSTGENTLNDWLQERSDANVYLYSLRSDFMETEKILWQKDDFVLYKLTHIPETELCDNPNSVGECYLKCIRGGILSPDGRSIKGVAPHLGVYRRP